MQIGAQNLILFPIPILNDIEQKPFLKLLEEILKRKSLNEDIKSLEETANILIYKMYGLTQEEIDFIEFQ